MCKTRLLAALAAAALAGALTAQDPQKLDTFVPPSTPPKLAPPWIDAGPPAAPPIAAQPVRMPTKTAEAVRGAMPSGFDPTRVMIDDLGAGGLWASTGAYKVHFAAAETTFVPNLGPTASQNWPVGFRLARITAAGHDLATTETAVPRADREVVSIDRGPVVERWLLRADEVEQTFVIRELPARGEVVVEVVFETDLACRPLEHGFEFTGSDGGVRYGAAVAVDARGHRVELDSEVVGTRIVHRVPARFVATAALPLVVDPVVSSFSAASSSYAFGAPDAAYEGLSGQYLVVSERRYSVSDTDVWCELRDEDGQLVAGTGAWIDVSTDDWRKPQVAANRAASKFLVVAEARAVGGSLTKIRGRIRDATVPYAIGAALDISTSTTADSTDPDVGGDGNQFSPDYWAVVWEHHHSATDSDIDYRMVQDDGTFTTTAALVIENSSANEQRPRISKSNGGPYAATQSWMVVFTREISPTVHVVLGANLAWDGRIVHPTFAVGPNVSGVNFLEPEVSSPTELIGGRRYHLVVSQRQVGAGDWEIWADLVVDGQRQGGQSLTAGMPSFQVTPSVDSDGCRFAVAYSELYDAPTNDYDVYAMTVHVTFSTPPRFGFTEPRVALARQVQWEGAPAVAARQTGSDGRYMIAWEDSNAAQPSSVRGVIYEGLGAGGLTLLPHGCHGFPITATGEPLLGNRVSFQVPGPTTGPSTSGTLFGLLRSPVIPLPMCSMPCTLGVDGDAYPPLIHIDIPCDGALLGAQVAAQGWDLVGGSCIGASIRLSDTYVMVVR